MIEKRNNKSKVKFEHNSKHNSKQISGHKSWMLLSVLFICVFLTACKGTGGAENSDINTEAETKVEAETNSEVILSFEANTIEGEAFTSEKFAQSKLTMLNVWATYCNPCLAEMPDLAEMADSYDSSNLQIVGIISDITEDTQDGITTAEELIAETGAGNYPHLLLNDSLYNNLVGGISSVPTTFFVNQKGEVLGYVVGANSKETWEEIIDGLLEEME